MNTLNHLKAIALGLVLFTGCKKEKEKEDGPSTFTVVEAVTNTPIAGAHVIPRACLYRDIRGCGSESPIGANGTLTTNSKGVATLSGIADLGSIIITKEKYWEGYQSFSSYDQPPTTTISLFPVATLKIQLIKQKQYPAGAKLTLVSPFDSCMTCPPEQIILEQLKDTTIYMRGKGNIHNLVLWGVNTGDSGVLDESPAVMVNRFDTALIEITY